MPIEGYRQGLINSDTLWTVADGPYTVVREVTVVPRLGEDGRARIGVMFRPAGLIHREFSAGQAAVERRYHGMRTVGHERTWRQYARRTVRAHGLESAP